MKTKLFSLLVFILLLGCGSPKNSPEYAVEKFYSSLAKGDINSAKKYGSQASINFLNLVAMGGVGEMLKPHFSFQHLSTQDFSSYAGYQEEINNLGFEDMVTVYFYNGYENGECAVVKINNEWKVHIDLGFGF